MEKYITDRFYGATTSDAHKGYSDESIKQDESDWMEEYKKREAYEKIGFGRDTGDAR